MSSSSNSSYETIALNADEFWSLVKTRRATDEVLTALEGRRDLVIGYSYYTSLNTTLDRLAQTTADTRREMYQVFEDLVDDDFIRRTGSFVLRQQRRRHHPYRRTSRTSTSSSSSHSNSNNTHYSTATESPDPNDIIRVQRSPNPSPPRLSNWDMIPTHGSRTFPINVDGLPGLALVQPAIRSSNLTLFSTETDLSGPVIPAASIHSSPEFPPRGSFSNPY